MTLKQEYNFPRKYFNTAKHYTFHRAPGPMHLELRLTKLTTDLP